MSNFLIICTMIPALAANEMTTPGPEGIRAGVQEAADASRPERYQLQITATDATGTRSLQQYLESETLSGIMEADLSNWTGLEAFSPGDPSDCTVSITVTVRVGWDSNFVEASASVSGIPCDQVVAAIKRLREQLMAGIE